MPETSLVVLDDGEAPRKGEARDEAAGDASRTVVSAAAVKGFVPAAGESPRNLEPRGRDLDSVEAPLVVEFDSTVTLHLGDLLAGDLVAGVWDKEDITSPRAPYRKRGRPEELSLDTRRLTLADEDSRLV